MNLHKVSELVINKIKFKLDNPRLLIIQLLVDKYFNSKTSSSLLLYCLLNQLLVVYLPYNNNSVLDSYRKFILSVASNKSKKQEHPVFPLELTDCSYTHESSISCNENSKNSAINNFKRLFKLYTFVYGIGALLNRKKINVLKIFENIVRSSSFLSLQCLIASSGLCYEIQSKKSFNVFDCQKWVMISSLCFALEHTKRRQVINKFMLSYTIEIMVGNLIPKRNNLIIIILMILMFYRIKSKDCMKILLMLLI